MTVTPSNTMDNDQDQRPRSMIFPKMEDIIQKMQHPDTGVPVRCQKVFLTTIPCAFTGYDLIEWLMENLEIDDSNEAIHLATHICNYGYFFPVTDHKILSVKDDGSLYRFQSPYFWPSQNYGQDNVDYAIYLAKRSMRNKQRHGLEEHEQTTYNKLHKMLTDKWDFIYMQAEEQVRLSKERKKADKVVVDSQERAFWRVHRPPPPFSKCFEEGVRRNYKPGQMYRKCTAATYRKEIAFLQLHLREQRMKMSKAFDSLVERCEQFQEHDPFLTQPLPTNPWITDDLTHWTVNSPNVEVATERRVKRWAFSLHETLKDKAGVHEFELFLRKEYSSENLNFWLAVQNLKTLPLSKVEEAAHNIYREYLEHGAPCEINIDSKTMDATLHGLKSPTRFTFDAAQEHIYALMNKDSYTRFIRSDQYKNLIANATNPVPKKKFFQFGSSRKKSPIPSPKNKRRGSASSEMNSDNRSATNSLSQHSYSTGNLKELDDKSSRNSPFGSTGDVKASSNHNGGRFSPQSLKKKLEDLLPNRSPEHSKLEVPRPRHYSTESCDSSSPTQGDDRSADGDPMGFNIAVPTTKTNINHHHHHHASSSIKVTPSNNPVNVVAPWEDES